MQQRGTQDSQHMEDQCVMREAFKRKEEIKMLALIKYFDFFNVGFF